MPAADILLDNKNISASPVLISMFILGGVVNGNFEIV
jgi:hypothetical protein